MHIGYNPDFRPFAWQDGREARGDLIDICRGLFDKADITAEFVALALSSAQPALQQGEVDALAGIAISPDRADKFLFSRPLIQTGGAWFVLKDMPWPNDAELKVLPNKAPPTNELTVTTPARGPLTAEITSRFPNLKLIPCEDYPQALQMVLDGAVNAAALNLQAGTQMISDLRPGQFRAPLTPFFKVALGIATLPEDPARLIERVNHIIPNQ